MVTPSFAGHLAEWSYLVESILVSLPEPGSSCGFTSVSHHTVLTDEPERGLFAARLTELLEADAKGRSRSMRGVAFRLHSLGEVLRAAAGPSLARAVANGTGIASWSAQGLFPNKHWLQSAKKLFGCLAAAGLPQSGPGPEARGDACFLLDSEGEVLRNGICHAATAYMRNRTVFVSPYPDPKHIWHDPWIELSRRLLAPENYGEPFGEFFAMESYHWFFEPMLVEGFLERLDLLALTGSAGFQGTAPFLEETFYHWLYPRREAYSYTFVDVYALVRGLVGALTWRLLQLAVPGSATVEDLHEAIGLATEEEARSLGRAFREHGVLLVKCGPNPRLPVLLEYLDLCVSSSRQQPLRLPVR